MEEFEFAHYDQYLTKRGLQVKDNTNPRQYPCLVLGEEAYGWMRDDLGECGPAVFPDSTPELAIIKFGRLCESATFYREYTLPERKPIPVYVIDTKWTSLINRLVERYPPAKTD